MIRNSIALEKSEALLAQPASQDAVGMEHRGVRGQAGPNGGVGVVFRPIDQFRQAAPMRFVLQVGSQRLHPGDDETVERAIPKMVDAGIEAVDVAPAPLRSRNVRQSVEPQTH